MSRIVVGVDGSPASAAALEWAIPVASRWSAHLEVVLAWEVMAPYMAPHPPYKMLEEEAIERAESTLAEMLLSAGAPSGAETRAIEGSAAAGLVRVAAGTDLLVLGAHGAGGLSSGLGSTATRCAVHSPVPTAVIPAEGEAVPDGPVVVGVDGSDADAATTAMAARLAEPEQEIVAAYAWEMPPLMGPALPLLDPQEFEDGGQVVLDRSVAALAAPIRERVTPRLLSGGPRVALLAEAERAGALVLGTRGHSVFLHRVLGSTVNYLLHHHPTPIVVIPVGD